MLQTTPLLSHSPRGDLFPQAGSVMPPEIRGLLKATLRGLMHTVHADEGSVCWVDSVRQELVVAIASGARASAYLGARQPLGLGAAGHVMITRQPLLVRDVTAEGGGVERPAYRTRSFLCVPLHRDHELYGVFNLTDKTTGEPFTTQDLECAVQVAEQLAAALHALHHTNALQRQVELSEKFAAIGRLAADLVHAMSNPLDGINRYTGLLLENAREGHLRDYLLQIKAGVNRMMTTIRMLGQFARLPANPSPVLDIHQIIDDALASLGAPFGYPRVTVIREEARDLPKVPDYGLGQAMTNLIKNACDAMPSGGRLTVGASRTSTGLLIRISDTGVGIPQELHTSIFEPFFTTKAPGQGTGLGLAIAQEIITRYQGTISVESEVGVGTTFFIHLPLPPT